MSVRNMYCDFRTKFPKIAALADKEHVRTWNEISPDFTYAWFKSLATVINLDMKIIGPIRIYKLEFEFLYNQYKVGNKEIQHCIETCFINNLFRRVSSNEAIPYWHMLPDVFKQKYIECHDTEPIYI